MKLKGLLLLLLLLIITYYTLINSKEILKPFYYLKDLLFYSVHAIDNEVIMSNELNESIINSLKEDIKSLEKLNNINLSLSNFDTINATVISRNIDYWFNTLTINKGLSDGVDLDMAVIDSDGLIGRVSMVTDNTSVVKLITTNDIKNKVSAVINNGNEEVYGIINGYDSEKNLLNLIITDNKKILENSLVITTGMGGVFPSGILIGKVFDVIKKEDDVTNIVRVLPSSNIEGERYVTVLSRQKISTN